MISLPLLAAATPPLPTWLPTDLSNLAVWQNSANTGSYTVNGSNRLVRQTDLSGNAVNWVPTAGAVAPLLVANALNGVSLFKLNDTDSLMTETYILPFVPGWGYSGPLVTAYTGKFLVPNGSSATIPALHCDSIEAIVDATETSGGNFFKGVPSISPDLTGLAYGFLSAGWPGPITPVSGSEVRFVLLSFKGTTRNEARVYFQTAASGSIPGYFATIDLTPFTHALNDLGNAKHFFSGLGGAGTELHLREWYVSTEDSPSVAFNTVRDYLIRALVTPRKMLIVQGDSLVGGFGIGQALAYPCRLGLQIPSYDVLNVGYNGRTLALLATDQPAYASLIRIGAGKNSVLVDAGTNDIYAGASAATTLTRLTTLAALWKAQGFTVYAADIIPRNFGAPAPGNPQNAAAEAERISYNAAFAALVNPNIDGKVRFSNSAPFNNANEWNSTTYYNADQTHLNALGNQTKADLVKAALFA